MPNQILYTSFQDVIYTGEGSASSFIFAGGETGPEKGMDLPGYPGNQCEVGWVGNAAGYFFCLRVALFLKYLFGHTGS